MAFTQEVIDEVWDKGSVVQGYDERLIRRDCCGAWMMKDEYGQNSDFGWVIDHVYPISRGGDDNIKNLRPMQWQNNAAKSDDYPDYHSAVMASIAANVEVRKDYTVKDSLQKELEELYRGKRNEN